MKKKWTRRDFLIAGTSLAATLSLGSLGMMYTSRPQKQQEKRSGINVDGPKPNIMIIMADDMGFSDIGCYGGEIETPNIDRLAQHGVRFTQFYNTARCSPARASMLTGLHPHQTGIGVLTENDGPEGYPGTLNRKCVTAAEVLKMNHYRTYMTGKWHISRAQQADQNNWPLQRGFDKFYGIIQGGGSYFNPLTLKEGNKNVENEALQDKDYYLTDAISDRTIQQIKEHFEHYPDQPFFSYVAYTAPHFPLHAREKDIAKYKGVFDKGWDKLRKERMNRLMNMGIIDASWKLSDRDPMQPAWSEVKDKDWLLRCMEVYAAQIDRMDQGIGKIISTLQQLHQLENTIIFFLSDNGASAEWLKERDTSHLKSKNGKPVLHGNNPNIMPGDENSYQSYGRAWANLSNTPFRMYKSWVHEGGIATPFIIHWPKGIPEKGVIRHTPCQLTDILPTILEFTKGDYPEQYQGNNIFPLEGKSLSPVILYDEDERPPLYFEHEGNAAIRLGKWKLVKKYGFEWELYDMSLDRTELNDLAKQYPDVVNRLRQTYDAWAKRVGVIPRSKILEIKKTK